MAEPSRIAELVLSEARKLGFDHVGICDAGVPESIDHYKEWLDNGRQGTMAYLKNSLPLRAEPANLLPDVRSIVAVGLNYNQPNPVRSGFPRIAKYALGRDYHKTIRGKLRKLQAFMESNQPGSNCRVCVDSAPILEREFAQRAGLGWFGKNTCLIDSKQGSWFLIGLLLTTAELSPSRPAIGGCGNCRLCIDACPTGAIIEHNGLWQVEARRCISYLTIEHKGQFEPELEKGIGDWTFGCDVCQEVCPFNQLREGQPLRAQFTAEPDFLARRTWPDLVSLSTITESTWDESTRGSPVRRAGLEGIKRNARINLKKLNPL